MTTAVAVVGASGYAGGELLRLLHGHPEFAVTVLTAASHAGQSLHAVHPQLMALPDRILEPTHAETLSSADLVFLALPHGASAAVVAQLPEQVKVVDLGADFRLRNAVAWARYYPGFDHAGSWVYGLPELMDRTEIAAAARVANPGCYATAIALGFAPLLPHVDTSDLVAVAASGTSGAGRKASESLLATEVMGSMTAYKVGGVHQHTPEIEQTLQSLVSEPVRLSFTPILAPMSRGILATLTARVTSGTTLDVYALLQDAYRDEAFVQVLPSGRQPATASVYGSNAVQLQGCFDEHSGRVVVTVVLDNLVKGAAGQAVQNANLMYGLPETIGLSTIGVAP